MSARVRPGNGYDTAQALVGREARRCSAAISEIRSGSRSTSVAAAVVWSLVAIGWGNGVVVAGRRFGHDQWITLIGVPLLGAAGCCWLLYRGSDRRVLGLQRPRAADTRVVSLLTLAAAVFAGLSAMAALVDFDHDMRGLRATRTIVGTAFGEELVHRGFLLTVWAGTGVASWIVFAANIAVFGAWHAAGAACGGFNAWEVLGPAALAVPLVWLRLRLGSILAPMAFHAAANIVGVFDASAPPCP